MRRRLALLVLGALVVAAACNEVQSYVFVARRYDPEAGCLEAYAAIDLVQGAGAGSRCAPTCFRYNGAVYTTRVCPPLPPTVEPLDQASAECVAANAPALEDAGCRLPGEERDASSDAGAPVDAGSLDAATEGG